MVVEEGDDDPADDHTLQSPKSSLLTGQELNSSAGQRRLDSSVPTMEPLSLDAPSDEVALAAGGTVDIWRWRNAGYLAQYAVVGFIYHGLPATIYGVFLGYLGVPSYVYATAVQVVTLPWAFKFVFGMMNDCVPLWGGYRRKPYMCIGWAMCCLTLVAMSMLELPPPYWCRGADGSFITKQLHPNGTLVLDAAGSAMMAKPCNPHARDFGGTLALWMALAACGYVVADVAADGLTVEYARREPLAQRGTTQSTVYLVRTCGSIAAIMLVGFGMNGKEYNGTFDWTLSFPQICLCFSVPCAAMIPASWFLVEDTPVGASGGRLHTFAEYRTKCWTLLQSKAMFYVVMYSFLSAAFGTISTTAQGNVTKWWAGVKNLQSQIFSMLGLGLFAAGLWLVKKRFLNASWRKMLGFTTLFLNAVDAVFAFCTIFDVVRNQYFYLGETVLIMVPEAAQFLVTTFIIVEMADSGNEGMVYGLLTTMHNLGTPFARALGNQVYGLFEPSLSDAKYYIADTVAFRHVVANSFVLSYALALAALLLLPLMPDQKVMAQQRKRQWPASPRYAQITLGLVFTAWVYAITIDMLAMFPSTMCLKIAGGDGCGGAARNATSV